MTNILEFKPRKSRTLAAGDQQQRSAAIVIFPGIRYERLDKPKPEVKPRGRSNRRQA